MFKRRKLRKKVVGLTVMMIILLAAVHASAEVNKLYDNVFTSSADLDAGWNNTTTAKMVQTNLMPSGYAVKNTNHDNSIWISAADNCTFNTANRYVMSYYINIQELTAESNAFFGVGAYSNAFRAGINTGTGMFQIDKGSLSAKQDLDTYTAGKTYQVVTRMWPGTSAPAAMAYLYDVETGELVETSASLTNVSGLTGDLSIKVGGTGSSGTQYISGFTLLEATDTDATVSTNVVNVDMQEAKLSDLPSEIAVGDTLTMPETHIATKGSTITYKCSDSSVIDSAGNVHHGVVDKRVFIIATITNGNVAIERARAIVVKGTGSKVSAKENWAAAGTNLSSTYVPTTSGFEGSWKNEYTLASDSTAPITILGNSRLVWLEGKNEPTENANTSIYNKLTDPVDMDINATYYASCVVDFESEKKDGSVRFAKLGFLKDGTSNNEISSVMMLNADDLNLPKVGMKVNTSTAYADNKSANLGSLYNVMMKINSVASGNDTVSVKMWPVGLKEPASYTYVSTAELTGTYSKIFAQTNAVAGKGLYFGDFNYEIYVGDDVATVAEAEAAVKDYITNGTALADVTWPLSGKTIPKKSYDNLVQLRNKAYVSEIALYSGDTRIANIADAADGNIRVVATVSNDSGSALVFNKDIYLAKYAADGVLENIKCSMPKEIQANGTANVELTLDNVANKTVRMFIFEDDAVPYIPDITFNASVKNY